MIFGDTPIVIQDMFGVTPKSFDPIDMVLYTAPAYETFGVVNRMMFAIPFQGLIAPKGVRVIDRPFSRLGLDMPHEFLGTDRLHHFGVDAVFPLQEPEYDTFARSRSASFAFPSPAKVGLIPFDLTCEFAALQLGQMIQGLSESLIDSRDHFDIDAQVLRQLISRLQQIEALQDGNLSTQPAQAFALPTELTFHIPAAGVEHRKRATENTLATPQKVGRTTQNGVSSSNHVPLLAHTGYETP